METITAAANATSTISVPQNAVDLVDATTIKAAFQATANRAQVGIDHKNVTGNPHGTTAADISALGKHETADDSSKLGGQTLAQVLAVSLPVAGTAANSSKLENNTLAQVQAASLPLHGTADNSNKLENNTLAQVQAASLPLNGTADNSNLIGGLRIVRGTVSGTGTIVSGTGFTVVYSAGYATITFAPAFGSAPSFALCAGGGPGNDATMGFDMHQTDYLNASTVKLAGSYSGSPYPFSFIAIGPA